MSWTIAFERQAKRDLDKLDPQIRERVLRFLTERVAALENPRSLGEALKGIELGELWKYRVGDYRIIASIEDQRVQILIVRVGNRHEVYRR
jgi:mRNA interferase RelE/StbE